MDRLNRYSYWTLLVVIILLAGWLRIAFTNTSREIVMGDETTYWNAARSIVDFGTLTRDVDGGMYRGEVPMAPTTRLSPGYPLFIAIIMQAGGDVSTVFKTNIILSLASLVLMLLIMEQLKLARWGIILALTAAALYPGFISNLDRMLTEQLFLTLFLGFVFSILRGALLDRPKWTLIAAIVLGLATHVRAQALPFAALAAAFTLVMVPAERVARHLGILVFGLFAALTPWWLRNAFTFHRLLLLTDAGEGPAIWGAVPYFIDMGSSYGTLAEVVARNMPPAPGVYYRWRIFGFLQFMWGDVWDERQVHPISELRSLLLLHPLTVVLPMLLTPLLALRRNLPVIFAVAIPMAFTALALPFHGLPRYAFPAVPFAFIALAALLSRRDECAARSRATWQLNLRRALRCSFLVLSIVFSALLAYSLLIFAQGMDKEMSRYRLARYMGTSIEQLGKPVSKLVIDLKNVPVENTIALPCGNVYNNQDAPPIIKLNVPRLGSGRVVTEVQLYIRGGFYFDKTTIYWTDAAAPKISENTVYSFPTNSWRTSHTVYIDGDVDHLMIVPFVFRWAKINLDKVIISKYRL